MIIIDLFSIILCVIGALYAWRFVASYSKDDWRRYEAGRHLMHFTRGLAVILTWSIAGMVIRALFPDLPFLAQILSVGRVFIFGWIAWMLRTRFKLLYSAHNSPERNHDGTSRQSV